MFTLLILSMHIIRTRSQRILSSYKYGLKFKKLIDTHPQKSTSASGFLWIWEGCGVVEMPKTGFSGKESLFPVSAVRLSSSRYASKLDLFSCSGEMECLIPKSNLKISKNQNVSSEFDFQKFNLIIEEKWIIKWTTSFFCYHYPRWH